MLTYFIQVSLIWIALYIVYATMLHRETFFNINRLYLLLSLGTGIFVPAIVPFISVESQTATLPLGTYISTMSEVIIQPEMTDSPWYNNPTQFIFGFYLVGIIILSIKLFSGLVYLWQIYRKSIIEPKGNFTLVTTNGNHQPFSFFGYIFVTKNDLNNPNINEIISHEIIHIREGHSYDIISVELLTIIFWFNPVLWFYKRSLRATHEFMADNGMINNYSKETYSLLLLGYTSSGDDVALVNPFFNSLIKKRIQMMYSKKSNASAILKYFIALPLVTMLTMGLATYKINGQTVTDAVTEKFLLKSDVTVVPPGKEDVIMPLIDAIAKNEQNSLKKTTDLKSLNSELTPLYILDGVVLKKLDNLQPLTLESVTVLKDDVALSKYGEKGRNGVVEMISKNKIENKSKSEPDTQPRFPGSTSNDDHLQKLFTFLAENIKYPESARKNQIEGKVFYKFVIDENGKLKDPELLRGLSDDCDAEVLRVIMKMKEELGPWTPATKDQKSVVATLTLPVKFALESNFRAKVMNLENLAISYYPNPATDYIMVDLKGHQGTTKIQLFDINGKVIKSLNAQGEGLQELNTSDLPAGEYILNVSKDKSSISEKVLIVR